MKKALLWFTLFAVLLGTTVLYDFLGFGKSTVQVTIPAGSGATEIVSLLRENHVILFPHLFQYYIREDAAQLRAGVHTFRKNMGYKKALEELRHNVPLENSISVTIPEGFEAREIGLLLEKSGVVTAKAFAQAAAKAYLRFPFLPQSGNIEGYLFPATYTFVAGESAENIVDAMVRAFAENMYTPENIARAEALQLSFPQALILASIVEREAALDAERSTIASVFHNRLQKNMHLESCATVQYILQERKDVLSYADTKTDSPYNTYLYSGLPPAPIASPGLSSLTATLYPAETNYLFFVADGTGGHTFSETYEAHLAASQ